MSFLRNIFGTDAANGKSPEELDAELAEMNKGYADRHGAEAARQAQAHLDQQRAETAGIDDSLDDEFRAGRDEAVAPRRRQLGSAVSLPFTLIPWQLWLLGGLVLLIYIGGPAFVRGRLVR